MPPRGENGGGGTTDIEMLVFVFGGFAVLVILWFVLGGPKHADLRGIFLAPPAPLGNGSAYGPQIAPKFNGQTPTTTQP